MVDFTPKAVWNADEQQLMAIFEIKLRAEDYLHNMDLLPLYDSLRALWREVDAKLDDKEQKEIKKEIDKLEQERKAYIYIVNPMSRVNIDEGELEKLNNLTSEQIADVQSQFFLNLEEYYLKLCRLMKQHGLYYREDTNDPRRAMIKR